MKRVLTIGAVVALFVGVSLPAAAISAPPQSPGAILTTKVAAQSVTAPDVAAAAVARDTFTVEEIKTVAQAVEVFLPQATYVGALTTYPAGGGINDGFGYRDGGEFHGGVDIMAGHGTTIVSASPGVVSAVSYDGGWGQYVKIDHGGGVSTLYSHMIEGSPMVGVGSYVEGGTPIGLVGNTGYVTVSHLHFEVYVDGVRVDPGPWLP